MATGQVHTVKASRSNLILFKLKDTFLVFGRSFFSGCFFNGNFSSKNFLVDAFLVDFNGCFPESFPGFHMKDENEENGQW